MTHGGIRCPVWFGALRRQCGRKSGVASGRLRDAPPKTAAPAARPPREAEVSPSKPGVDNSLGRPGRDVRSRRPWLRAAESERTGEDD